MVKMKIGCSGASESIKIKNSFNQGKDEYQQNKSLLEHLRIPNYKISLTMVEMKSTKISRSGGI